MTRFCMVVAVLLVAVGCGRASEDVAAPATHASASTTTPVPAAPATTTVNPPHRVDPAGHPAPTVATTAPHPAPTTSAPPAIALPPPSTAAPTTAPPPPPPPRWTAAPYHGLGTWLDTWDWSPTFTDGAATLALRDIDAMAAAGVETIYIQTARADRAESVLDASFLRSLIARAHADGMAVVAWYLPTFQDPAADLRKLVAVDSLPLDGLAVDVESRVVLDAPTRTARLIDLSAALDARFGDRVLGAITLPPVVTEVINPAFWPGHPWENLGHHYDVFMPMGYWGNRTPESGWRDGYRYTVENIDLLRQLVGRPDAPVHAIGGVGSDITGAEIDGMVRAARERGAIGGSVYDWRTTSASLWPALAGFRGW